MTSTHIEELLAVQDECLGMWQLRLLELTPKQLECRPPAAGLRKVPGMDGVWTSTRGSLTARQRRRAATLTAPDTALAKVSACLHWEIGDRRRQDSEFVVVMRKGWAGPKRFGDVLVCRTREPDFVTHADIPVTSVPRTLADVAQGLATKALRRAVIEALRLEHATWDELEAERLRRSRRPGMRRLGRILGDVAGLPVARTRSNAEAQALVRRRWAGRPGVAVNEKVAGFEADLIDHERKLIIEIDGPAFHQDLELDARKEAAWRAAGYTVIRRASDDAYNPRAEW